MKKMKINELTIADLKASYDFLKMDIKALISTAKENNISPSEIPAYDELKELEFKLHHQLLNKVRFLE